MPYSFYYFNLIDMNILADIILGNYGFFSFVFWKLVDQLKAAPSGQPETAKANIFLMRFWLPEFI